VGVKTLEQKQTTQLTPEHIEVDEPWNLFDHRLAVEILKKRIRKSVQCQDVLVNR
jgi:hypothetical protein